MIEEFPVEAGTNAIQEFPVEEPPKKTAIQEFPVSAAPAPVPGARLPGLGQRYVDFMTTPPFQKAEDPVVAAFRAARQERVARGEEPPRTFGEWLTRPPAALIPTRTPTNDPEAFAKSILSGLSSFTSPLGLATLGAGAAVAPIRPLITGTFGGLGAKNLGESLGQFAGTPAPQRPPGMRGATMGDVLQSAAMMGSPALDFIRETRAPETPAATPKAAHPDLAVLERMGLISPEEARPTPEPSEVTKKVPEIRDRIATLEQQLQAATGRLGEAQNAARTAKLTDGQWLAMLEEWNRRRATKAESGGEPKTSPAATPLLDDVHQRAWDGVEPEVKEEIAKTGVSVTDANMAQLIREARTRLTRTQWAVEHGKPVPEAPKPEPKKSGIPDFPLLPPPVTPQPQDQNAEAIRSSQGRIEEQGLLRQGGQEARSDDIQRPPPGPPGAGAPAQGQAQVQEVGARQEAAEPDPFIPPESNRYAVQTGLEPPLVREGARAIQRRKTVELLNDLGVARDAKGRQFSAALNSGKLNPQEIVDKYQQAKAVFRKLNKQGGHPDVGGTQRESAERNAVWNELESRFDRLAKQYKVDLEGQALPPTPPREFPVDLDKLSNSTEEYDRNTARRWLALPDSVKKELLSFVAYEEEQEKRVGRFEFGRGSDYKQFGAKSAVSRLENKVSNLVDNLDPGFSSTAITLARGAGRFSNFLKEEGQAGPPSYDFERYFKLKDEFYKKTGYVQISYYARDEIQSMLDEDSRSSRLLKVGEKNPDIDDVYYRLLNAVEVERDPSKSFIGINKTQKADAKFLREDHPDLYRTMLELVDQQNQTARTTDELLSQQEQKARDFATAKLIETGRDAREAAAILDDWKHERYDLFKSDPELAKFIEDLVFPNREKTDLDEESQQAPVSFERRRARDEEHFAKLGLEKGKPSNAYEVLDRMASDPATFSEEHAQLAKFLNERFSHVLPLTTVERAGDHPQYFVRANKIQVPESRGTYTVSGAILHEATHAAVEEAVNNPRTDAQVTAVLTLGDIMRQAEAQMPEDVKKFYDSQYRDFLKTNPQAPDWDPFFAKMNEAGVKPSQWYDIFYALKNPGEFLAMTMNAANRTTFRDFMKGWEYKGASAWESIKHTIKQMLGIPAKSALDRTVDVIMELGKRGDEGEAEWSKNPPAGIAPMGVLENISPTQSAPAPSVPGGATPRPTVTERTARERVEAFFNRLGGRTMPRLSAADVDSANAGIRYASARVSSPLVARYLASNVLGREYKNAAFDRVLGDVLVEDRLRAIKQAWWEAAQKETDAKKKQEFLDISDSVQTRVGAPGSALRTKTQYQSLLKNPNIVAAIERHKQIIQPLAEQWHTELGGKEARPGEQTGAFVNLIAILAPDDVESARSMIYGSRRGDTTNPLRRGSVFSKQAKGSAPEYERSYRTMAERMIRGNYEQKALRDFYTKLEEKGLAVEEKPGVSPPRTLAGKPTKKITIEIRGAGPGMTRQRNLWVREDLYDEVRHSLAVDDPIMRGSVLKAIAQGATEMQIVGATDAVFHTMNMAAAISTAPGGRNWLHDILRKQPGLNVLDAAARVAHQSIRVVLDSPEVQKELADIAEIGAGRGEPMHKTVVTKAGEAVLGERAGKFVDPSFYSSKFIKLVDKAGRLSLNRMFDNLVERDLADDTPLARREFINRMGQYNERLMPKLDAILREIGVSSFIVAGKNFNRLALQRFLFDPGVIAKGGAGSDAWWKLRLIEASSFLVTLGALSYGANKVLTGTPWGRPGTPPGAIDTGKDDKQGRPIVIDPLQTTLWRRGLRISGLQAAFRGAEEGLPTKEILVDSAKDVFNGLVHPYAGPVVRALKEGVTGYDEAGYLVSRNPDDPVENAKAALKNGNPMVAAYFRGAEQAEPGEKGAGKKGVAQSLGSAIGVRVGRLPTLEQKAESLEKGTPNEGKSLDQLPRSERLRVMKEVEKGQKESPNLNELARRATTLRSTMRGFGEIDETFSRLDPEVQKFIESNGLNKDRLQYKQELTEKKTRIPLTPKEKARYERLVVEEYNDRIKRFMPFLPTDKARRQEEFDKRLTLARARARAKMKVELGRDLD